VPYPESEQDSEEEESEKTSPTTPPFAERALSLAKARKFSRISRRGSSILLRPRFQQRSNGLSSFGVFSSVQAARLQRLSRKSMPVLALPFSSFLMGRGFRFGLTTGRKGLFVNVNEGHPSRC
jgi:hypothetical protein